MGFYLYHIHKDGETLYIGKGSGRRLSKQMKRFQADGEILVDDIAEEADAYRQERELIAQHQPPLNRDTGGRGGWSGPHEPREWPNGFTDEGLILAAPHLARLLAMWHRDNGLVGVLGVLGAYINAHGLERIAVAVLPHLKRLVRNDLALESKP